MQTFIEMMSKIEETAIKITVPDEIMGKLDKLSEDIIKCKMKEYEHKKDNRHEKTRWMTGLVGEAACEIYYGIDIIDWSAGDTKQYAHPDITNSPIGNVGIKTVEKRQIPYYL